MDCFSFFIISGSPLFTIFNSFLSFITSNSPLSAISDCILSLVASGSFVFAVFDNSPLSPILSAGFWALFLTSIPSCACCFFLPFLSLFYFFLPFLPILLAHNPNLLTEKRLFY